MPTMLFQNCTNDTLLNLYTKIPRYLLITTIILLLKIKLRNMRKRNKTITTEWLKYEFEQKIIIISITTPNRGDDDQIKM